MRVALQLSVLVALISVAQGTSAITYVVSPDGPETIGGAIGPLLAGRIFDMKGSYQLAFLVCAILSITGLILISLLRPPGNEEGDK